MGALTVQNFVNFLAKQPGVASIELANYQVPKNIVALVPKTIAVELEVFPIDKMGKLLTLGMACPLDSSSIERIERETNLRVKALLCAPEDIRNAIRRYYPAEESDVIPMLFGEGKKDVAGFASGLPYVAEPEAQWNYNSGASNLLARMVSVRVGGGEAGMRAFMQRELFDRIGMKTADPRFDESGNFMGGSHCYCSGRDFARFGYLFLRDGV